MSPESRRVVAALAVLAVYLAVSGVILWRAWHRRRVPDSPAEEAAGPPLLIAYASQTGFAEALAQRTAARLRAADMPVRVRSLDALDTDALAATARALFLVSTTGEGDAPDSAAGFLRRVMEAGNGTALPGLGYGMLALGDRGYARFCGFGRRLDAWLRGCGARPLFERIEVHDGAEEGLRRWQAALDGLTGSAGGDDIAATTDPATPWRLVEREILNPAGLGPPVFRIVLASPAGGATWRPGDVAVLSPRNAPGAVECFLDRLGGSAEERAARTTLVHALEDRALPEDPDPLRGWPPGALLARLPALPRREYTIASVPEDGRLELIVRQHRGPDGRLGLGSGWLTAHAPPGGEVALRLRSNPGFHPPEPERPLILIGNGTGIAGLRAHLRARSRGGAGRNWLLFGERSRAGDLLCGEEIAAWQRDGLLERVDLAFSREADAAHRHVQDALRAAAGPLRDWVAAGAAILVCGSRQGMAPGVEAVLEAALGAAALEALRAGGRYRRDVY